MTTVDSTGECPQCGNTAQYWLDCSSHERDINCPTCGYSYSSTQLKTRSRDGKIRFRKTSKEGFGCVHYKCLDSVRGTVHFLKKGEQGKFLQWIIENVKTLAFATMTVQQPDGSWREVSLVGEIPGPHS